MRIALVTDSYPPEVRASANLMVELAQDLRSYGHQVCVLTCAPSDGERTTAAGATRLGPWGTLTDDDGILVARINTLPVHNTAPLARGVAQVVLPLAFANAARLLPRPDCTLIYSPPLTLGLVGRALRWWSGAPYVVNVQDLFPQNAIDLGLLKNGTAIAFFRAVETAVYRGAARIAVHSAGNRLALVGRGDLAPERVVVAHNWVDCAVPTRDDVDPGVRHRLGWGDAFVVFFAGTLGYAQDLDLILDAAKRLRANPRIRFAIYGDGVKRPDLERRVRAEGLSNVIIRPPVPREEYPQLVASADVGLITLQRSMRTPVVPSKLLGYMAAACPSVASLNPESDGHALLRDAACGISVPVGDVDAFVGAIASLEADQGRAREIGRNGRAYALRHLDRGPCTRAFDRLCVEAVTAHRGAPAVETIEA
jgi:colanic acid biosynthesis glycosyl transferase WcaI